jgi:hypothetical protein
MICPNGNSVELVETIENHKKCDFCCENFPNDKMSKKWKHKDVEIVG